MKDSSKVNDDVLLHLPDEILLFILEKLQPLDVLHAMVGINERLDNIAGNVISHSMLDLSKTSSITDIYTQKKFDFNRLCSYTLPQVHQYIKGTIVESSSASCILHSADFPNLLCLCFVNLTYMIFSNDFSDDSSFDRLLKQQITHLKLSFDNDSAMISTYEFSKNVYAKIFALGEKLTSLDFRTFDFCQPSLSFHKLPVNSCCSSALLYLNISVSTFDDFLTLLDGRLPQLSTFHVIVREIDQSLLSINHTMNLSKLKVFSLKSYRLTFMYDSQIVPLLRRMLNLEILTLFLTVKNRERFVDGNHLNNEVLVYMSQLNKFIFDIRTVNQIDNGIPLQSTEDIQLSFKNSKWSEVTCWTDHFPNGTSLCNVFSLPFTMGHMCGITNHFPGGIFPSVYYISMLDVRPFEHNFFNLIAKAFPSLMKLALTNMKSQLHKQQHWQSTNDNTNLNSSIVVYPKLRNLYLENVHNDYIEEFLHENNSSLPRLTRLNVKYEQLVTVTNNFTNNKMRQNCVHLKCVKIEEIIVYPKEFYSYFPSL